MYHINWSVVVCVDRPGFLSGANWGCPTLSCQLRHLEHHRLRRLRVPAYPQNMQRMGSLECSKAKGLLGATICQLSGKLSHFKQPFLGKAGGEYSRGKL